MNIKKTRYFVRTFGCKTNQYESQLLKELIQQSGNEVVEEYCDADYVVVNSCAVTQAAERDVYKFIRRVYRESKNVKQIYVVGCYAEYTIQKCLKEKFFERLVVNLPINFLGCKEKYNVIPSDMYKDTTICESKFWLRKFFGTTRAYVKIQDGCNNYCSYCIVPFLRNRMYSRPLEMVLKEVDDLVRNGYTEIYIVGTNVGKYKYEQNNRTYDFIDLSERLLCEFPEITLLFSSLEPVDLNEKFFDFLEKYRNRIFPHFHIPLQAADDEILQDMGRNYTVEEYLDKIKKLRKIIPGVIISSDIIVGYPIETQQKFLFLTEFIKKVGFNWVHVFPYSPRLGTKAYLKYGNTTAKDVKQKVRYVNEINTLLGEKYFKQLCKV
ncbi:MAG: MiaB/RimO family radical SAM methylthiotransferase [Endomicrobia bacterium]|nr:MiaB/RimO family radical SAM methylthiotransferase [Endomicrobiia bacterium]MDW8055211.1 MiaB/RimO family radical SAM methylthiotransferase [Elusimicrobiota bacterium]